MREPVQPTPRGQMQDYLLARVEFEAMTGCWLWARGLATRGYGQARFAGAAVSAHRLSWLAFHDEEPGQRFVCHRCDTPACVNPDHLWLGTARENLADMDKKGRRVVVRGENAPWAKISDCQARDIDRQLRDGRRHSDIAADVGCSLATVSRIAKGNAWLHVTGGARPGNNRGERHGFAKLTESDVRTMRDLYANGAPTREIISRFQNVAAPTVRGVLYRQRWGHVK